MKDNLAAEIIRIRLKYDWIVLMCGSACVLVQLVYPGDWKFFLLVVMAFVVAEAFGVPGYRKLMNGGEAYHMVIKCELDQDSKFGTILIAMACELVMIAVTVYVFMRSVFLEFNR